MPRLLLLILLLAFALRVYALGSQSLWYDEAVTAQVTQQGLVELARWTADDIQPPLYYAITAGWVRMAGVSEWALRFPSAFFGVLMVALAYALGRRLFGCAAGVIAALLAALHPLWLYYSQEARMYTLLAALGMLAGYALLRVLAAGHSQFDRPKLRLGWWAAFLVAAIALLYTHYFAAFLLAAFGLYFLIALLLQRDLVRRRLALEGAMAALLIAVAYLPWLPNALRRFGQDASYWRGALKLNEAVRHIAISFSAGETVLEQKALPLAWAVGALALVCFVALLWEGWRGGADRGSEGQRVSQLGAGRSSTDENGGLGQETGPSDSPLHASRFTSYASILFVMLYLLAPIAGILFLSANNPKFNPRYLMMASPGLVLLLAGGLALPFRRPLAINRSPLTINHFSRLLSLIALTALLAIFLYADRNWFADPAFTKDDWRGAVAYVKSQLQPDEAVILVSGHALPAWRYYAPDVEPVRLPAIETLDVNAVLDLDSTALTLDHDLEGKAGAWLLQWQDDVVDPNGVTPFLLGSAGQEFPSEGSFWGLGRPRHYRWTEGTSFARTPAAMEMVNANFGNQVQLLGFSQSNCLPFTGDPDMEQGSSPPSNSPLEGGSRRGAWDCPVHLFWRALAPLAADYKFSATLVDEAGHVWSQMDDRRLAAYDYPTFRWQTGVTVLSRLDLVPELGTPPGEYRLRISVYDAANGQALSLLDTAGAAQGQTLWLAPVQLDRLATTGPGLPSQLVAGGQGGVVAPATGSAVQILHATVDPTEAEAGQRVLVQVWWGVAQIPSADYMLRWEWIAPDSATSDAGSAPPGGAGFPASQWPAGSIVRSQVDVSAPGAAQQATGAWRLRLGLADPLNPNAFANETIDLPVTVRASQHSFQPPPLSMPANAQIGDQVRVLGVDVPDATLLPGATVPLTVAWQALEPIETSYTGFVHLLDAAGAVVAQDDHLPRQGQRPTTTWLSGEVVADGYELALPADLPAGQYWLEIGLYDADQPGLPRPAAPAVLGPITVASR